MTSLTFQDPRYDLDNYRDGRVKNYNFTPTRLSYLYTDPLSPSRLSGSCTNTNNKWSDARHLLLLFLHNNIYTKPIYIITQVLSIFNKQVDQEKPLFTLYNQVNFIIIHHSSAQNTCISKIILY